MATQPAEEQIYQLLITLDTVEPPIWRRVQVPAAMDLTQLHLVVQLSLGWEDCHAYSIVRDKQRYVDPDVWNDWHDGLRDATEYTVADLLPRKGQKLQYEYDDWEHTILSEGRVEPEVDAGYPRCIEGARACPFEECGGSYNYMRMIEALADNKHPEHGMASDWADEGFDPEHFDVAEAEARIGEVFVIEEEEE